MPAGRGRLLFEPFSENKSTSFFIKTIKKGIIMILNILPILAAAAASAPNARQIDSAIESRLNEAGQVVHEIEDQGVGFFPTCGKTTATTSSVSRRRSSWR